MDALEKEVTEKVALMRALGIDELETSTGFARKIRLLLPVERPAAPVAEPPSEQPDPASLPPKERPTEPPAPVAEPEPEPGELTPDPEAKQQAKRQAKQEKRLFGAGK